MAKHRIVYVSQEITPYLHVSGNADICRAVPQAIQDLGYEVRTFMPDFGEVNERRNQLHEVIRLSGVSIVIGDNDHPLVVKVASMQPSRIQVYFIDNDDYFQKLASDADAFGSNRTDNDERLIFYAHGTVSTAKKLQWEPEIVDVTGWMSSLVPYYLKRLYGDGPSFHHTRVVYTITPEEEIAELDASFFDKLREEGAKKTDLKAFVDEQRDLTLLRKMAIRWSDGVVFRGMEPAPELMEAVEAAGIPWISISADDTHAAELDELYKGIMTKKK